MNIKIGIIAAVLILAAACSKELAPQDDSLAPREYSTTDLVTVRQADDGAVFLQYGFNKLLASVPGTFTRPYRAMASMTIFPRSYGGYHECSLDWIEPLDEGVFSSDASVSGSDGLDIDTSSFLTRAEDGFLSVYYQTWWGQNPVHHDFTLVAGLYPDDPYHLVLRHNANADAHDIQAEAIICFDISSLPPTDGQTKTITLNWIQQDGTTGTAYFGFKTR